MSKQITLKSKKSTAQVKNGKLVVVGSGIKAVAHMTNEAMAWIKEADVVFFLVSDPFTIEWIKNERPDAINLYKNYSGKLPRVKTYEKTKNEILAPLKKGKVVCAVFYGHPGVFVSPSHWAIKEARLAGYSATMLPGISAEDCLFADLGVDPCSNSCQTFEATEMLTRKREPSIDSNVIIWQVGVVADWGFDISGKFSNKKTKHFVDYLEKFYGKNHTCYLYNAAIMPHDKPKIWKQTIRDLNKANFNANSTLYIPPKFIRKVDKMMVKKLGLDKPVKKYKVGKLPEPNKKSPLYKMISKLSQDSKALVKFECDKASFFKKYGSHLNNDDRKVLISKDTDLALGQAYTIGSKK